jgi:hypothetical protein
MLPFDPFLPHVRWFNAWRKDVQSAKDYPQLAGGYGRAACIAQAMYVIYLAHFVNEVKNKCRPI